MKRFRLQFHAPAADHDLCRALIGPRYVTTSTGYSVRVDPADDDERAPTIIFSESYMGPTLMGAIAKVRNHVGSRVDAKLVRWCRRKPTYTAVAPKLRFPGAAEECCEVDLSAAYLTAARDIGAVSEKVYHWILKDFNKESRLKIVGSLGTMQTVRTYRNGKEVGKTSIRPSNPETRRVWDSIVAYTDKIMECLQSEAGRDFLYRWADAIFVKPAAREKIVDRMKSLGFGAKSKPKIYTLTRNPKEKDRLDCSDGRRFFTPAYEAARLMRKVGL